MKKVLIAMSGGVDSAVAAMLVKNTGAECVGATMILSGENSRDIADAKQVAERVGIPHCVIDLRKEFEQLVINRFIDEYEQCRTPNPCYFCNQTVKFGLLHDKANEMGFDAVATGHYAQIQEVRGRFMIRKAADLTKDQSYFLAGLTQNQIDHSIFPIGKYTKEEIRRTAEENGFVSAHRKDSQDVCFVPNGDYAKVITEHTNRTYPVGNFITRDGRVLGQHKGLIHYTIGQRRGLGLALPEPMYVCKKDIRSNEAVLCRDAELYTDTLIIRDINWISCEDAFEPFSAEVRIRYRHREQPATVIPIGNRRVFIKFSEPQRAVTPGQIAVIYDRDIVVGGGIIE